MKKIITAIALLCALNVVFADPPPAIRHTKICAAPEGSDPAKIRCSDWNADHVVDPVLLSAELRINVVAADPNGVLSGFRGDLARDTTGQLYINTTGGTVWVPFVRADGNVPLSENAWAFFGDSGINSQGVNTDNSVRWNNVVSGSSPVPNANVVLNTIYATASSEPLTMVDLGTTDLRAHNVGSPPGYGFEFSFGQAIFDLVNGVGTTATAGNKPWLLVFGISGVELKQLLPASTYGQASTAFGGLNAYNFWKARTQALLAASGRKLGGIILGSLGGNDASNSPDANAVAANMVTLATQIRSDFGPQVAIVWLKLHSGAAVPFNSTVRAQQVTGCSLIPNCRLLVIDSYPLLSDNLHWGADPVWDMGLQQVEAIRQMRGIPARVVTQPTIVGYGTPDYNKAAGALAPRGYPRSKHGDIELLGVASLKLTGSPTTIPTPAGWTSLGNSSQTVSGETQEFALFIRNVTQSDLDANGGLPPAVSITTGNDENYAVRITIRGPSLFPTIDGSVISYAATAFGTGGVNAGGTTTTGANDLVLTWVFGEGGSSSPTEHFIASNATTSPTVVFDAPLVQNTSNFGLLALFAGVKATPGATGTTVITPSVTTNPSGFTVCLTGV
jgi:hypothetical protein